MSLVYIPFQVMECWKSFPQIFLFKNYLTSNTVPNRGVRMSIGLDIEIDWSALRSKTTS